jgi:hypothetical protein
MLNKLIVFITLATTLQSCGFFNGDYDNAIFEITNNTSEKIDSLFITNSHNDSVNLSHLYYLKPKETTKITIDMTNAEGDGDYNLHFKSNHNWHIKRFGYFTNGSQTEKLITIQINENDSITINSVFK